MPSKVDFPRRPDIHPIIYAFTEIAQNHGTYWKVGYTHRTLAERMAEHYPTNHYGDKPYEAHVVGPAVRPDGSVFMDHDVHRELIRMGVDNPTTSDGRPTEWFVCDFDTVRAAYMNVYEMCRHVTPRTANFAMREEQAEAVSVTSAYFRQAEDSGDESPRFLWNAKMRFGKTFAAYELAKAMGFKRVLILSFKTAVEDAWEKDLATHVDFDGWQFVSRETNGLDYESCDVNRPIVCFGSFQDFLGYDSKTGGIKSHNEWVHLMEWDLVIFDEYHFGAWRDSAKALFDMGGEDTVEDLSDEEREKAAEKTDSRDERDLPIQSRFYLYLSGTPFRALNSGEFMEDQIFSWTYADEQRRKAAWPHEHAGESNPYAALPKVVMLTYQMPEEVIKIALKGEFNAFSLNEFFRAEGEFEDAHFVHEEHVQKWLDILRDRYRVEDGVDLKLAQQGDKPPMPFSDVRLLDALTHTIWFLPDVASCYAMKNTLSARRNSFYHEYEAIVVAGTRVGNGTDALVPVRKAMRNPLETKTITLTCGKLTTGVTVRPWGGIFMLRDLKSPETYFQSAFRVQSPWEIVSEDSDGNVRHDVMKEQVYIFDFAINRALYMVANYSTKLASHGESPERAVAEFLGFLPVLAYDGSSMTQISASDLLEQTMSGTTATMLAKRWTSALLVNVDDVTLKRVLADENVMQILESIEAFRSLGREHMEAIVNQSDDVKKVKRQAQEAGKRPPKEITEEEKNVRQMRKQLRDIMLKFASRVPVFMYLTDHREECLMDIIRKLDSTLFTRVTGITIKQFETLLHAGLMQESLMNDSVYMFRRYEDSSLVYTGLDLHEGEAIGGFTGQMERVDVELDGREGEADGTESLRERLLGSVGLVEDEDGQIDLSEDIYQSEALSEPQPWEWTSEQISALAIGTKLYHRGFGPCEISSMTSRKICLKFDNTFRYYNMPGIFRRGMLSREAWHGETA